MDNSQFTAGIILLILLSVVLFGAIMLAYFLILTFNDNPIQDTVGLDIFEQEEGR